MHPREPAPDLSAADGAATVQRLRALAHDAGIDHLGVAPAAVMQRARRALLERREAGLHDTMQFTYRNPERSTDPLAAVHGARSMIVAARSYVMAEPERPAGAYGAVARYAWVDHYAPLRAGLRRIVVALRAEGHKAVAFADDNSVVDREAAWLAGLGWFGKNANVLVPGSGSFFVLGSVVTTAPLPTTATPIEDGCGTCRRCIDGCPTEAIVAPGVIDAGRCLAWLLQRPGVFPRQFRAAAGTRIYGCDECQLVCPPTVRFERRTNATLVAGATATSPESAVTVEAWVDLVGMLRASNEELLARHGRWYLADRDPVWWRRNALIALGNSPEAAGDVAVSAVLTEYLAHDRAVLRVHAVWAAARLGLDDLLPITDPDPDVRAELALATTARATPSPVRN